MSAKPACWRPKIPLYGITQDTTVSCLREKRDREKKLLTRAAYEEIGGVAWAFWLRVWHLASGTSRLLRPCSKNPPNGFSLLASPDSRMVLRLDPANQQGSIPSLSVFDLASSAIREITSHGNRLWSFALNASGKILVTGGLDDVVRVGSINGKEPHLLFGHKGSVTSVAVSPHVHWIASGSEDGTIRLWPMPDLSKPPLHTLPHNALLAKLKSLTNLRAVRDPSSDTGWKLEIGSFPGWKDVPTW